MRAFIIGLFLLPWVVFGQAPVISNIVVDGISHTAVRIQWDTDLTATNDRVEFDPVAATPPFEFSTAILSPTSKTNYTVHSARPGGLKPGTTYHYRVCSTANSTEACSAVGTFTTNSAPINRFRYPTAPSSPDLPAMPSSYAATYAETCSTVQSRLTTLAALNNTNNYLVTLPAGAACTDVNANNGRDGHPTIDLRTRACGASCGWIVLSTTGVLPPEGVRFDPTYWDATQLASITGVSNLTNAPVVVNGSKYRLVGLKVHGDGMTHSNFWSVLKFQNNSADIIIDRCWFSMIDGPANSAMLSGWNDGHHDRIVIANSYMKALKPGGFTYAYRFTTAQGLRLENNYWNAPGITLFAEGGGGFFATQDVTVKRNLLEWDESEKETTDLRQLFELKQGFRVLLEGNVFRNQWSGGKVGSSNPVIVLTTSPRDANQPLRGGINALEDIAVRSNTVYHTCGFLQVVERDNLGVQRVMVENNLAYNVDGNYARTGVHVTGQVTNISGAVEDLELRRNTLWDFRTGVGNAFIPALFNMGDNRSAGIRAYDNVYVLNSLTYGMLASYESTTGILPARVTTNSWTHFASMGRHADGDQASNVWNNLIVPGVTESVVAANYADPSKRLTVSNCNTVLTGFPSANICFPGVGSTANETLAAVPFENTAGGNFRWKHNSPYQTVATNGFQLGADVYTLSVAQGWVYGPYLRRGNTEIGYETRDTSMKCYFSWDGGAWQADSPGSRFRTMSVPGGSSNYRMVCAGGSLPDSQAGSPAAFSGTL